MLAYFSRSLLFLQALSLVALLCCSPSMAMDDDLKHLPGTVSTRTDTLDAPAKKTKKTYKLKTAAQVDGLSNEACIDYLRTRLNAAFGKANGYSHERKTLLAILKEKELAHRVQRIPHMESVMLCTKSILAERTARFKKMWTYVFGTHKNVFVQNTDNVHTLEQLLLAFHAGAKELHPPLKLPAGTNPRAEAPQAPAPKCFLACSDCCERGGSCFCKPCCLPKGSCFVPDCCSVWGCLFSWMTCKPCRD